ncbi:MAG: diguanylate cyclase [Deltaproteobacteria bacterium]|nr:diguanylate cyclase [Deltaproteobacteria bacterium]
MPVERMGLIKKSLRAKFTLILLLAGAAPLLLVSVFFYYMAKDALFKNVFAELRWNADAITTAVEEHFADTGRNLVIASQNAAFAMYYLEPDNRPKWLAEQHKTFRYLRSLYPEMIDEACFIDSTGTEVSRIVFDKIASSAELSSGEERSAFFWNAFKLNEGEVLQDAPTISEDTHRWVLPNATPIFVKGRKTAILHFEIALTHFQGLLKRLVNQDRGYAFILNDRGEFMAHTLLDMSGAGAFPMAISADAPASLRTIYGRMAAGEAGIEEFSSGGKSYYIIFAPIKTGFVKGINRNRWDVGYVISGERVYVEATILRDNFIVVALTFFIVVALAYVVGKHVTAPLRELVGATNRLAAGEMPRVEIRREDEIGQLSNAFNVMVEAIKRRDDALRELAVTDGLTGLYNHRHFKAEIDREVKAALRFNQPLSLIMADVDWFKQYNDKNGHTQGDIALKRIAEVFAKATREVDLAARYGGEEFAVILPQTDGAEAMRIAERIRGRVALELIPFEEDQPNGDLTVSIGVATLPEAAMETVALIVAADKALYRAKEEGRNKVVLAGRR